jgi:hypothetical protein
LTFYRAGIRLPVDRQSLDEEGAMVTRIDARLSADIGVNRPAPAD